MINECDRKTTEAAERFLKELTFLITPQERRSVVEWATAHIVLPEMVTQNDGHYSTDHCGYVDDALEDFRDPTVTDSTWCWAAQCFKTTTLMVGLAYKIDQHPENAMWLMPNGDLLKSFAETKWAPIIDASPTLRALKPKNADKFKKLEQQFGRMALFFVASGSQKNLKGRSVGLMILDEIDDIEEQWNKRGMSAIGMAESRTKSFIGSKIFKTGTPQLVTGPSWQGFMAGDRRLIFVDCPKCAKETTVEFSPEHTKQYFPGIPAARVVWGEEAGFESAKMADGEWDLRRVAETARIKCPHCAGLWTEVDKLAALKKVKWKATNPLAPDNKRSRRVPSICSPHPKCSIASLAVKFLTYLSQPGGLRNFLNEECSLPWQPKGTTISKSDIASVIEHSPSYLLGEIPRANLAMLILSVDVQQTGFWYASRAWFGCGSSALIDYGTAMNWEDLIALATKTYPILGTTRSASSTFCLIDSGYNAKRHGGVYDFCLGIGAGRFFPTKGRGTGQGMLKTVAEVDANHNGREFKLLLYDDNILKYDLYLNSIKERSRNNWWLPRNIGKDYEAQLTDEYLTEKEGWKCREDNNHLGDCEKMQLIMPAQLGKEMMAKLAEKIAAAQIAPV
jgi:phage terminase large subunit GpA-like protein